MADVAGKGIAAALVMALARATLRTIADSAVGASMARYLPGDDDEPGRRRLHRDVGQRDFVCCALAVVEPARSRDEGPRLRLANGGQVPPMLCRPARPGSSSRRASGFRSACCPDPEYAELVVDLAPGDVVVFASDGLPEAQTGRG